VQVGKGKGGGVGHHQKQRGRYKGYRIKNIFHGTPPVFKITGLKL
jgi:hypothetical protein